MTERKTKTVRVIFFDNGMTGCFDETGEQMIEIQKQGWLSGYLRFLEMHNVDIINSEFILPNGANAVVDKTAAGDYTWKTQQGQITPEF